MRHPYRLTEIFKALLMDVHPVQQLALDVRDTTFAMGLGGESHGQGRERGRGEEEGLGSRRSGHTIHRRRPAVRDAGCQHAAIAGAVGSGKVCCLDL